MHAIDRNTPVGGTIRPIGILAAVSAELEGLLALMGETRIERIGKRDYYIGTLGNRPCVAVLARIGKVAAAVSAVTLIREFNADTLLFTGLAGGVGRDVNVGDVVIATHLVQHDMDASPLFARHEIPLLGHKTFGADDQWNRRLTECTRDYFAHDMKRDIDTATQAHFNLVQPTVHHGLIASGDQFINNPHEAQILLDELPGLLCVEMEGAAVAQVCHEYDIPFAVIRTISDRADDSADTDFIDFLHRVASRYSAGIFSRVADLLKT